MNPLAEIAMFMFTCGPAPQPKKRKGLKMFRAFNAFQIVAAFVATPFGIAWLSDATFKGASVAFYAACAAYVVAFFGMVASVFTSMEDWS